MKGLALIIGIVLVISFILVLFLGSLVENTFVAEQTNCQVIQDENGNAFSSIEQFLDRPEFDDFKGRETEITKNLNLKMIEGEVNTCLALGNI